MKKILFPILVLLCVSFSHCPPKEDPDINIIIAIILGGSSGGGGAGGGTGSSVSPSVNFTDIKTDTGSSITYNFSSVNFGSSPSDTRLIVVAFSGRKSASVASATIAGIAATIVRQEYRSPDYIQAILAAEVPSGTSGTVSITCGDTADAGAISVYAIDGMSSNTVKTVYDDTSGPLTVNVGSSENASIIAFGGNYKIGGGTWTWSGSAGITERSDIDLDGVMMHSTANMLTGSALSSATITANPSAAFNQEGMIVAIWE